MSYENQMNLIAKLNVDRVKNIKEIKDLSEIEFKVYSQWGEDGIIQYLINKIPIKNKYFIEFGVQNYRESNTRFLLMNNNWSGLIMDSSEENITYIKNDPIYWQYDLNAKKAFITKDNINDLIEEEQVNGEIGLLSVDIDGNDYWIWEAIKNIDPAIVICEYNSILGNSAKITIPYKEDFYRTEAHYSNLYFGASLPALKDIAEKKGYTFVGCTQAGNDAFFVKNKYIKYLNKLETKAHYVYSKFKESRNLDGNLTYIRDKERIKLIQDLEVLNIENNELMLIKQLLETNQLSYSI
jgi:hypothetical protein